MFKLKKSDISLIKDISLAFFLFCLIVLTGCTEPLPDGMSGAAESSGACTLCHGNDDNAAPSVSSKPGALSTSDISVGAHQVHLKAGTLSGPMACESCHIVPLSVDQDGHNNGGSAEITWGGISSHKGLSPVWDRTTETCASTYCHGASLSGGSNKIPVWTIVNGTQAECGTCHGNPPPAPHTDLTDCYSCHPDTVDQNNSINVAGGFHINGTVQNSGSAHPAGWYAASEHGYSYYLDTNNCKVCHGNDFDGGTSNVSCDQCHDGGNASWRTDCTFCHGGSDNQSGAPPYGVHGETEVSSNVVGVHSTHVRSSDSHPGYDCTICHVIPSSFDSTGHIDSTPGAEVNFSILAGNNATYSNKSCSSLYCHGNGRSDSDSLSWVTETAQDCASCHAYYYNSGDLSGEHRKHIDGENYKCSDCHGDVINDSNVITNKLLHINGTPDVSMNPGTYSGGRCSNTGCHGNYKW